MRVAVLRLVFVILCWGMGFQTFAKPENSPKQASPKQNVKDEGRGDKKPLLKNASKKRPKNDSSYAKILVLNKNTLHRKIIKTPIGEDVTYDRLNIRIHTCFYEKLNIKNTGIWAFAEVWKKNSQDENSPKSCDSELLYSAWINTIESYFYDPEYEIQILSCHNEKKFFKKKVKKTEGDETLTPE